MKKLIIVFALLMLTGCAKKIFPEAPTTNIFSKPPEAKESKIILPLSTEITGIENTLNTQFPSGRIYTSGRQKSGNSKRYWIDVFREKNIVFTADQGNIRARIPVKVKAKAAVKICAGVWQGHWNCWGASHVQNGRTETNVAIDLLIKPKLNPDYSISTELHIDASIIGNANLEFHLLGFKFSIPIKSLLRDKLKTFIRDNKPKVDQALAEAVSKINIKNEAEKYWKLAGNPIPLGETGMHLNSKPTALYFQNIHSENNKLAVSIGVGSKLSVSENPINNTPALPNLSIIPEQSKGVVSLNIPISVSFETLNQRISKDIKNETIVFKKYKFKIKDVKFSGYETEGRSGIYTTVDFKCTKGFLAKGIKGKIHLTATPAYDKDLNLIFIDSFKLSTETLNLIRDKSVSFLANKVFYNKILKSLKIDFTEDRQKLETAINKSIENYRIGDVNINGDLESLELEGIYIDKENLKIVLNAEASIKTAPININETTVTSME